MRHYWSSQATRCPELLIVPPVQRAHHSNAAEKRTLTSQRKTPWHRSFLGSPKMLSSQVHNSPSNRRLFSLSNPLNSSAFQAASSSWNSGRVSCEGIGASPPAHKSKVKPVLVQAFIFWECKKTVLTNSWGFYRMQVGPGTSRSMCRPWQMKLIEVPFSYHVVFFMITYTNERKSTTDYSTRFPLLIYLQISLLLLLKIKLD